MHIIDTTLEAQSKLFEKLLSEALQNSAAALLSEEELAQPCSTLIMRPENGMAEILAGYTAKLAERFPGQLYYGPENFHLTVCGLPDVHPGSILHRHLRRSLASHAGALPPLNMPVGGFGIIGGAIIVRAFDTEGLLARLVKCLVADIEEEGFAMADVAGLHARIFWLTAARLLTPPSDELVAYIARHQQDSFGVASFERLELVSTNSLFSPQATTTLEKYNLGDFA